MTTTTAPARAARTNSSKHKRVAGKRPNIVGGALGWLWLVIILLPIYYIVLSSLRTQPDYYVSNPLVPPVPPSFQAFGLVLENQFLLYLRNSLVVTLGTVIVLLVVAVMASYVIVRGTRRSTQRIFSLFLLGLAIPAQATIIPVYYMICQMHLYDTLWALILPSIAFGIPITVMILVNFMRDVPKELFESMRLDGAGDWRILFSLVIPMTRPAIVTVGIYEALQVWNGFLFPLVLTQSSNLRVLPLSLWTYQGEHAANTPAILAAVLLSAMPILAAYIVGRRQLVAGLTAGIGK